MKHFFAEVVATLDFFALGEKQDFSVVVAPNEKRELLEFKSKRLFRMR